MPSIKRRYWLVLLAITAAAYVVLATVSGPVRAFAACGLFGLAGLQPLLYRKRGQKIVWDERDTLINQRAVIVAYSVFWLVFTFVPMGTWALTFYYAKQSQISVHLLPAFVMLGFVVMVTARPLPSWCSTAGRMRARRSECPRSPINCADCVSNAAR